MERFYGNQHSVDVSSDDCERLIRAWLDAAQAAPESGPAATLVAFFETRLKRAYGCRAFRIAPEPIAGADVLAIFAEILSAQAEGLARTELFLGRRLRGDDRRRWLAQLLDLLGFVNEARGVESDALAPVVEAAEAHEILIRRMWSRFVELSRRENYMFPDDPRLPSPLSLLAYLDQILELVSGDGREESRAWPFPKILWEREILLEKLGRFEELAETMRRSAALEGEAFQQATEEYLGVLAAS